MEEKIKKAVEIIRKEIPDIIAIYLYGSQADGTAHENSDWDFAVYIKRKLDFNLRLKLIADLSTVTKTDVDLVNLIEVNTLLQNEIISSGKLIFCSDENLLSEEENTIKSMYIEFMPHRNEMVNDLINRYV